MSRLAKHPFSGLVLAVVALVILAAAGTLSVGFHALHLLGFSLLFALIMLLLRELYKKHKLLQEQQAENQRIMQDVVNGHPAGIYRVLQRKDSPLVLDSLPQITYTYLNDNHATITGLSREELMEDASRIQNIVHPKDQRSFFAANNQAVSTLGPFRWEGRILTPQGLRKWVRIESNPRKIPSGDTLWTGILIDITAQKELEEQILRRESFERLITELSSDFVNIREDDFDRLINMAIERIGRFCHTDRAYVFVIDHARGFASNTHEWCNLGVSPQMHNLQEIPLPDISPWVTALQGFKPINIYDVRQMDEHWAEEKAILEAQDIKSVLVVPIISQDQLMGFVGFDSVANHRKWEEYELKLLKVFSDLIYNALERKATELALRASEKKYRVLTDNAFDGIYLLRNQRFEYVNQKFCEITGYTPEQLYSPEFDIWEMFTPESKTLVENRRKSRRKGEQIPGIYEVQIFREGSEILDVEISTNPLSEGEDILILGIMRNITERKLNEKLRNQVEVANQTVRFKQNFLANMSHEIRTPLTGVMGMIEILTNTRLDDKQRDYLNTIRLSTENLREIINQILDYSKIEAGQVNLRPRLFDAFTFFENTRKLYSSICQKDIQFRIVLHPGLPKYLVADENRLAQVVNNLISNAVKFTRQGEISLEVKASKTRTPDCLRVKVTVCDTGIGIRPEAIHKLFLPFEEIETSDKRHFDGTGLGLSICKELVKLMGGKIHVTSEPGKGSCFWFTFLAQQASEEMMEETGSQPETSFSEIKGLRILFAEDKMVNQKVIELMLSGMGHSVTLASNGKQVLDVFQPGKFDLILMDIQMPEMDGISATNLLKEKYTDLPPIVGLSANAFEGDREKYIALGLDEYLTKPVSISDFEKMIKKLFKY